MLPQTGRAHASEIDRSYSWDASTPPTQTRQRQSDRTEAQDPPVEAASREAVVAAFGQTNVGLGLQDFEPYGQGRRSVRAQYQQHAHAATEQNILPMMALATKQTPVNWYLGGTGVDDREVAGTFVDRLGNSFEILESRLPPPNKDYTSTAASSSHRNLERCMGGAGIYDRERKKREVSQIVNPAEPRGDDALQRERHAVLEVKGRQMFFNQTGVQEPSDIDVGRSQYDGYNVATPYSSLIHSVEPCWRSKQTQATARRPDAAGMIAKSLSGHVHTTEREERPGFARKPRPSVTVRAGSAHITLPYLSEASLRTQPTPVGGERRSALFATGPNATGRALDVNEREETELGPNTRVATTLVARSADPEVTADRTDVFPAGPPKPGAFPVAFSGGLPDVKERGETQRNNGNVIRPAPSRDLDAVHRVVGSVERDGGDDDPDVSHMIDRSSAPMVTGRTLHEDTNHILPNELPAHPAKGPEGGRHIGATARSAVRADRPDAPRNAPPAPRESLVAAQTITSATVSQYERPHAEQAGPTHAPIGLGFAANPVLSAERAHAAIQPNGERGDMGNHWIGDGEMHPQARNAYPVQTPSKPASVGPAPVSFRSPVVQSAAHAGLHATYRHDSRSAMSTPTPMVPSKTQLARDRSTPARPATPSFPTAAQWVPKVQFKNDSLNRDTIVH